MLCIIMQLLWACGINAAVYSAMIQNGGAYINV